VGIFSGLFWLIFTVVVGVALLAWLVVLLFNRASKEIDAMKFDKERV
jgi:cytoskeletal protein RodZ